MSTRIGILTGGGDCPGLNGVIRAVTLHARQTFGWEVLGIKNGFEGLYKEDYVELTAQRVQHSLQRGGTMLGSSNRANRLRVVETVILMNNADFSAIRFNNSRSRKIWFDFVVIEILKPSRFASSSRHARVTPYSFSAG